MLKYQIHIFCSNKMKLSKGTTLNVLSNDKKNRRNKNIAQYFLQKRFPFFFFLCFLSTSLHHKKMHWFNLPSGFAG